VKPGVTKTHVRTPEQKNTFAITVEKSLNINKKKVFRNDASAWMVIAL
jgi:hypothetical protein